MKILFLTLLDFSSFSDKNIYCDLLREFIRKGHDVYCVSPTERRYDIPTHLEEENHLLKLRIGNTQKTNLFEKGISTIRIEKQFISAIKEYFSDICFDLVLYSTPPITLCKAVDFVKKRDNAKSYLLLKDIFPQNAVDLGMLSKKGIKGFIYKYFRKKEKKLYEISDKIGCMSPKNVQYLIEHNQFINQNKIEVCPNCIEPKLLSVTQKQINDIRTKYNIPVDKKIFVYGGNLGVPQGISFLIDCLSTQINRKDAFFLIVGDGTEYYKIEKFINYYRPNNIRLLKTICKSDFDKLLTACDVGMIFLDNRFTIPNFPSRLLSYMQARLPVFAVTDSNTDVGKIITEGKFGWWCESSDINRFSNIVDAIVNESLKDIGDYSYKYLLEHYTVDKAYNIIFKN